MGIHINTHEVARAIVTRLDYCKNFILPPYIQGDRFFNVVKEYQVKGTADFNHTRYANGKKGEQIHYFQESKNLRIYEKIREIQYRNRTKAEQQIAKSPPYASMPRIELGIHDTTAFKKVIEEARRALGLAVKDQYTVADLFRQKMSQKVLTKQWKETVDPAATSLIECSQIDDDLFFSLALAARKDYLIVCGIDRFRKDIASVGYINAVARLYNGCITSGMSDATFYRYKGDFEDVMRRVTLPKTPSLEVLKFVKHQLKDFDLVRPVVQQKLALKGTAAQPTP